MAFTSNRPVSVDGVRLDTLAWNIEKINRATAARRNGDYAIPNLDGAVASLNDPLEPATYGLEMWLRGTDADGAVPVAGSLDTLRANLDELLHLFGQRHKLLDLREKVSDTTERRAWAKVTDAIAPDLNTPGSAARFTVSLVIPAGMWEDVDSQDWVMGSAFSNQTISTLTGSTERINDAIHLVTGPVTNPRISDVATGMYVELGVDLAAGQFWRFNSATWASRYGAGLGLGSADTTGTDGSHLTSVGGPSRAYGLPLTPARYGSSREVRVTLDGTGRVAGTTKLSTRTRRKYAA